MLGLLTRSPKKKVPRTARPVRLFLERLETRDCPSTISLNVSYAANRMVTLTGQVTDTTQLGGLTVQITGVATTTATTDTNGNYSATAQASGLGKVYAQTSDNQSNVATITLNDIPPQITNFTVSLGPNNIATLTGTVTGQNVGGLTVAFDGSVTALQGKTATVNADGSFLLTVALGNVNGLAEARAVTTDWWGLLSTEAICDFDAGRPTATIGSQMGP
jgi:hypothetical protein